ncbi:hypothetical protein F5Y16DRAFT_388053 [Xylariaceae sp. FL0255]|nr:hypothetical protein F5Y16DRAFT_388053 [Xylariaceae sp. FL0255]
MKPRNSPRLDGARGNLWHPSGTVRRDTLCLGNGRTLADEDWAPMDAIPLPKGTSCFYRSVSKRWISNRGNTSRSAA